MLFKFFVGNIFYFWLFQQKSARLKNQTYHYWFLNNGVRSGLWKIRKDLLSHSLWNKQCLKKRFWLLTIWESGNKEQLILLQKFLVLTENSFETILTIIFHFLLVFLQHKRKLTVTYTYNTKNKQPQTE